MSIKQWFIIAQKSKNKTLNRMSVSFGSLLAIGTVIFASMAPALATAPTTFFDIGTLGGATSTSLAINSIGQVTGVSATASSGPEHAFYWDSGTGIHDLGVLAGDNVSRGLGINSSGVIVGNSGNGSVVRGFVSADHSTLTALSPQGISSTALAINDTGHVFAVVAGVPKILDANNNNAVIQTIPDLASCASDLIDIKTKASINIHDEIAGTCQGTAFTWDSINGKTDLGSFDGSESHATGLNDHGVVAGNVIGSSSVGVFVWDPATGTVNLSSLKPQLCPAAGVCASAVADGINNAGQVVGTFANNTEPSCGQSNAFVWDPTLGLINVGTDSTVSHGFAINDNAQVVGESNLFACPDFTPPATDAALNPATDLTFNPGSVTGASAFATASKVLTASAWGAKVTAPVVSVGDATVVRGNSKNRTVNFPVTLSTPARTTVTVTYSVQADSVSGSSHAAANIDFKTKTGTLTFKPNTKGITTTTAQIGAVVYPSTASGSSNKTFTVKITGVAGGDYTASRNTATGTILGDSNGSNMRVSVGNVSIVEGDHGKNSAHVWVTLSKPATSQVTVTLNVSGGSDYKGIKPKVLTFKVGQFQKSVALSTLTNMLSQSNKVVNFTLSSPSSGLSLSRSSGTITILNDD